jgi:hypothetical protein
VSSFDLCRGGRNKSGRPNKTLFLSFSISGSIVVHVKTSRDRNCYNIEIRKELCKWKKKIREELRALYFPLNASFLEIEDSKDHELITVVRT